MHGYLISLCIARKSSALNRSSVLQHFEDSNAIEIPNRIMMFDFYPGLPHIDFLTCSHITIITFTLRTFHIKFPCTFPTVLSLHLLCVLSTSNFLVRSPQYYHYIYFAYFPHQISLYVPHIVSTIACWHRLSYPTIHVPTLRFLTTYSIYYLTSILSTSNFLVRSLQYYHYIYFAYFPHQISLYVPLVIACWCKPFNIMLPCTFPSFRVFHYLHITIYYPHIILPCILHHINVSHFIIYDPHM